MTTAIIGTGGIGSVIARQLASGGETLRLASADNESARTLAAEIGAVVLALRFTVLKGVIDQIADKLVVVPSNPLSTDAQGNVSRLLPEGQSSGKAVAGWLPAGPRLAMAFGTLSADHFEASGNRSPEPAVPFYAADDDRTGEEVERLIRMSGFEPVKAGSNSRVGSRWAATFTIS